MKLKKILKQLVTANMAAQEENQLFKNRISDKTWLNESCTIKLGTNRQAGHTTAGLYLGKFYKILYVSPFYKKNLLSLKAPSPSNIIFYQADSLIYEKIRGSDFDIVVVDTVSLLQPKQLEDIKNGCAAICKNKEFVLVLLQ